MGKYDFASKRKVNNNNENSFSAIGRYIKGNRLDVDAMLFSLSSFSTLFDLQPLQKRGDRSTQHGIGAAGNGAVRHCCSDYFIKDRLPHDGKALEMAQRPVVWTGTAGFPFGIQRVDWVDDKVAANSVYVHQLSIIRGF